MNPAPSLVWSPTVDFVRQAIADEKRLRLIVAPFIKLGALKELIEACEDISELEVVVRWQAGDLVAGVSDVEIYPYLKELGVPLFRHTSIHLKLLVFNQLLAFHSSGNVTMKGLGLVPNGNIEIGCSVTLGPADWRNLFRLLGNSQKVDDAMYEQAKAYALTNTQDHEPLPPMNLQPADMKEFSKNALPTSENPAALFDFYSKQPDGEADIEESVQFIHDIVTYEVPDGLDKSEFFSELELKFKTHPFISKLVEHIRSNGSLSFGAVNAWITDNCSDTPRPYRRDLKTTTRHLYDWLSYFFDEVTWDTPNYSMVIYWNKEELSEVL